MRIENYDEQKYKIMRKIFSFLTGRELCIASFVCRYWANVAEDENYERGPINMRYTILNGNPVLYRVRDVMIYVPIYPCLSMIFYSGSIFAYATKDCFCKDFLIDCYSISLKMPIIPDCTYVFGIFLPASPKLRVNTCTFFWHSRSLEIMYCPELRCFFSPPELPYHLRSYIESCLFDNNGETSCMILLCDRRDFVLLTNFVISLKNWFPNSKIPIWGGAISEITVCNNMDYQRLCRIPVNLICYFISSEELQTWTTTWSAKGQTNEIVREKLTSLKERIKLKQHSLCLIFISGFRPLCNCLLELYTFKEIFPQMPYFYVNSDAAICGDVFEEVNKMIFQWKFLERCGPLIVSNDEIAILVLTY